jgi:putative CocE/NonD family hydrolase
VTWDQGLELRVDYDVALRADVWRPSGGGRHPALLIRQPYGRRGAEDITYALPAWYARHGFAVVSQDSRGRWGSDGPFTPFECEGDDGAATVEWVASQPWCDGNVAMYGFSYAGATQLQAAVRRPAALKAIAPVMTSADYYEGWTYKNGAFSLAFNASWATNLLADVAHRRGDGALQQALVRQFIASPSQYDQLPLSAYPNLGRGELGGFFSDWLEHETKDDYWARWDVTEQLGDIEAEALIVAGLYDVFLDSTLRVHERLAARAGRGTTLVLAPWYHIPWGRQVGAFDFGPEARNIVDQLQLEHFSRVLRGDDTPEQPPVKAFVTGRNSWASFEQWPPPGDTLRLYLHGTRANSVNGDGLLSDEPPSADAPDMYSYDPAYPVPSLGGRSCCFPFVAPMGGAEQSDVEINNGVLVYTSEPLPRDVLVAGDVRVTLYAATSEADTDWVVRLCDVTEYGQSYNIGEDVQRARFSRGTDASRPIPAGEVTRFDLGTPCCHLFQAGHRIRLHVTSSAFPLWDRNLNTGRPVGTESLADAKVALQTVHHDADGPSCISLPVLG